jgi:AcrR family transcriptional regulator
MTQGTGGQRASRSSKAQAGKSTTRASSDKPYHHGALPQALLDAAEVVLRRDGMRGLTLRAISREAGVSHTAAQHHFGDMSGVLSELAASGHRRLASALSSAIENVKPMRAGRQAVAHAYVRFAVDNPDLFRLMSRNELLDAARPALVEARRNNARALARLHGIDDASARDSDQYGGPDVKQAIGMTSAWAYVHGLASLLIDGRLNALATATEGVRNAGDLVSATIEQVRLVQSTPRDGTKQR